MNAPTLQVDSTVQRTQKGLRFDRWYDEVRNLLDSKTPDDQRKAVAANQTFCKGLAERPTSASKAITPQAVHVDSLMSTFSTMYANDEYIGERCMPPAIVSKRSDKYATYNKRDRFGFPDDALGSRGKANEIQEGRSTANYSVNDYGLQNFLDLETLQNQDAPLNEMLDLNESVNEAIAFKRENRISTIVEASGSYTSTAATGTPWDDPSGGSVVADIVAAKAALWRGANPTMTVGVCGLTVFNSCIVQNPKLTALYAGLREGLVTMEMVARYFGLDALYVGAAREDTANEGQTASYSRIWSSDVFAVLSVARRPSTRSLHFGTTFRMNGDPVTTQWTDPSVGKRGGIYNKVAVSEDHKIVAGDAGFLITNCIT